MRTEEVKDPKPGERSPGKVTVKPARKRTDSNRKPPTKSGVEKQLKFVLMMYAGGRYMRGAPEVGAAWKDAADEIAEAAADIVMDEPWLLQYFGEGVRFIKIAALAEALKGPAKAEWNHFRNKGKPGEDWGADDAADDYPPYVPDAGYGPVARDRT